MTRVQIDRLRLENFKCHRVLELVFGGQNVSIYGDNATGKTSIYDALTWLLFGKDSAGNGEKNFDVKPLDSAGAVADHNAITSVEAALLVAGGAGYPEAYIQGSMEHEAGQQRGILRRAYQRVLR